MNAGLRKRDPLVEIELALEGDRAAALGLAGRKLTGAVAMLADFDRREGPKPGERRTLLHAATNALWAYVVQREAIGITNDALVTEVYGVTPELWRRMGAIQQ